MHEPLALPAISGKMGDWTFFSSVMPIGELATRVNYAEEIHTNRGLSDMIQRKLLGRRAKEICQYLTGRPDRFFNSLVIAFYGGPPTWFSGAITPSPTVDDSFDVEDIRESGAKFGVLQFTGNERLFALDGQHRLSGIRIAQKKDVLPRHDCVPVVFVGHSNTTEGIRRSREIFTTLNKEAKKVGVGDIIALDENDPAAIVTRMIVERETGLSGNKIAYKQTESINPESDLTCITTITNLYYAVLNLFSAFYFSGKSIRQIAALPRPADDVIEHLFDLANRYFKTIGEYFPDFGEALRTTDNIVDVIAKRRNATGGHILFRPVGITILTRLVCQVKTLLPQLPIEECVKRVSSIPLQLSEEPYRDVLWEPETGTMRPRGKRVVLEMLSHHLHLPQGKNYSRSLEEYKALKNNRLRKGSKKPKPRRRSDDGDGV